MPMVPVVVTVTDGDVVKIVVRCYAFGQVALNVYYYYVTSSAGGVDYKTLLALYQTLATGFYIPVMHSQALYVDTTMQIISGAGATTPTLFTASALVFGAATGNPMPQQVSGLITRRVNLTSNANRGRVYIPFPAAIAGSTVERPSSAYTTLLGNLQVGLLPTTAPISIGGQMWSPGLQGRIAGFTPLLAALPSNKWATQKRRGDYGIPNTLPGNS
jgi:hypothetical protein